MTSAEGANQLPRWCLGQVARPKFGPPSKASGKDEGYSCVGVVASEFDDSQDRVTYLFKKSGSVCGNAQDDGVWDREQCAAQREQDPRGKKINATAARKYASKHTGVSKGKRRIERNETTQRGSSE